ncbi:uncharacterized protein BDW43DRAFT_313462 [Aspergillus alliaceus]|uniref:uncharacterized protein n=1 Tax=Petromyces alliaceus TaxID=209559 RepID=UPI0012A4BB17|nr:uncharacterized protein BDW43DRAFT_313462 [Aspergillus alliaceus]KAB8230890.1 hypothetical protein BDW43DRAFT_313462 [Aspergillus alliaceus]
MASPLEPNQAWDQTFRVSDLNFTTPLDSTPLPQFSNEGVAAHRNLSQKYRLILEQKDALSIYLSAPSRGGYLEGGFSKMFSTRKPSLISSPARISPPGWTDVLRNVDPAQLQPDLCGSQRCHVRGAVIDLPSSDSSIIRTGLLQKLLDPWPHPRDLQLEMLPRAKFTVTALQEDVALSRILQSRLNLLLGHAAQNSSPKPSRPRNSVASVAASEAGNLMKPDEQNGDVTSNVPVNMQDSCPEVANGTDQSSEASNYECRGDEDYQVSEGSSEGSETGSSIDRSPRPSPTNRFRRWSPEESSRLLPFLDAHKHLSGPEIEQAYFRYAGIYWKELALKAKARRIQHGWLHGARKTRRRRETNQLVMSQVPRHSYIPPQVAGAMSETERVYPDSLGRAVRSDKQGDRSQAAFTPGDTATCDTSMLSSMIVDQPTLEAQYLSGEKLPTLGHLLA